MNKRAGYAPPHSKGSGEKKYIYTLYALSSDSQPKGAPEQVSRDVLLESIKDFFSSEVSGAHRLPNGNMLICAGVIGNLFEVTPKGVIELPASQKGKTGLDNMIEQPRGKRERHAGSRNP